jgi:hypothetical protein
VPAGTGAPVRGLSFVPTDAALTTERRTRSQPYAAEKARGGTVVLRQRWQRALFIVGLAAPVVLLLVLLALREH